MNGLFIAIEGIDGTGKTSVARLLADKLRDAGHVTFQTHEPSSPQLEGTIREFFKRTAKGRPPPEQMAVYFTADRLLHMENFVIPMLENGCHVITDRHKLSTLVYQTVSGCQKEVLEILNSVPSPDPDITILLTADPVIARQRMIARNPKLDSYEADLDGQRRMQELYLENIDPKKSITVCTDDKTPEIIASFCYEYINTFLIEP